MNFCSLLKELGNRCKLKGKSEAISMKKKKKKQLVFEMTFIKTCKILLFFLLLGEQETFCLLVLSVSHTIFSFDFRISQQKSEKLMVCLFFFVLTENACFEERS